MRLDVVAAGLARIPTGALDHLARAGGDDEVPPQTLCWRGFAKGVSTRRQSNEGHRCVGTSAPGVAAEPRTESALWLRCWDGARAFEASPAVDAPSGCRWGGGRASTGALEEGGVRDELGPWGEWGAGAAAL